MSRPYNADHIDTLCFRLGLGTPHQDLVRVHGGFHHEMWRLDADPGTFAIKQLSSDTDVHDPLTIKHYNATESIARAFARHDIPAIFALEGDSQFLHVIEDTGYLIYPWTDAVALEKDQILETHALEVATILAGMHRSKLAMPDCKAAQYDVQPEDKIVTLLREADKRGLEKSLELAEHRQLFLTILADLRAAAPVLLQSRVISHGDLDHKNVLWDADGRPLLIDWESAGKLNPTHEIILESLEWSGITARFKVTLFEQMLRAYTDAGGCIEPAAIDASLHCVMGDWLNWLMYNLGRNIYLEEGDPDGLGAQQVDLALQTILRLQDCMPGLLPIVLQQCGRAAQ